MVNFQRWLLIYSFLDCIANTNTQALNFDKYFAKDVINILR